MSSKLSFAIQVPLVVLLKSSMARLIDYMFELTNVTLTSYIVYLRDTFLDLYLGHLWHVLCTNDICDLLISHY